MPSTVYTIIGIDCATVEANVGLALGRLDGDSLDLLELTTASPHMPHATTILNWIDPAYPTLLALDAPLGWPAELGKALVQHSAGQPVAIPRDTLFRRATDQSIRQMIGKQPLEVGADRIARTAHAALALLEQLRLATGASIPLAWDYQAVAGIQAIEVYPAATLLAYGVQKPGAAASQTMEQAIQQFIKSHMRCSADTRSLTRHALDAAVCVLAGADFLRGHAVAPLEQALARKEGWIWSRKLLGRESH